MSVEHFPGCHPEHAEAPKAVPGHKPAQKEACWHCGVMTPLGCYCEECLDGDDYIPVTAVYHCPACRRWWAWMTGLNVTTISFDAGKEKTDGN
jgi:hypothetical protein